jgi:decaprenylphospho-beta-D-ribofuranose 2-oxidase
MTNSSDARLSYHLRQHFGAGALPVSIVVDSMSALYRQEGPQPAANAAGAALRARRMRLSGWGRYPSSEADVYRPEKIAELAAVVAGNSASLIARGAGRAYGDAALNDRNRVVDVQRLNRMLAFDPETGVLRCEAGVTIAELLEIFLPRGFFPPVTPGTKFVTLGGSLAADVHGKNHHRDASLGSHVLSFDLMLASGEVRRCSREENSDLFWATVGGMGLTGVILELELRLRRVESAYITGEVVRARNVDEAIETFERADRDYGYSVAWIDCTTGGRSGALGRSVINLGNFAPRAALNGRRAAAPLSAGSRMRLAVPINLPNFALNPFTVRAFNEVYYALHRGAKRVLADYESFFYPLDSIHHWNRIYGKRGFVQYQCVWPLKESRAGLIETLEAITENGRASFLTVLKKFGPQEGILSFPMEGYTLALDFPVEDGLFSFLDRLDEMVLKRGGRVYLAKDARMRPEVFKAMYRDLERWQAIKAQIDPGNCFSSALSRRLGITAA